MKDNKQREIYLGNGKTINVNFSKEFVYYLDIDKLEKLVDENLDKEIVFGATTDWFWTATNIKGKKDFLDFREGKSYGLRASCWDTFSVEIDGERQDCTVKVPKYFAQLAESKGFFDGLFKTEQWLNNVYRDVLYKMKYEMIQEFQSEIFPIIKKWKEKISVLEKYSPEKLNNHE